MESPRIVVRKLLDISVFTPRPGPKWFGRRFRANQKEREHFGHPFWWRKHSKRMWVYRECPVPPEEVRTIVQSAKYVDVGLEKMVHIEDWAYRPQDSTYMGQASCAVLQPRFKDSEEMRSLSLKKYSNFVVSQFLEEGWLLEYPERETEDPYRPISA